MSGTPSRDTFDPSKNYREVQYVGGTDRRLFDFELNEMQQLERQATRNFIVGLFGAGLRLNTTGRLTTSVTNGSVSVEHGFLLVNGEVVNSKPLVSGLPDPSPESFAVFSDSDADLTIKTIYFDVYTDIVDFLDDPTLRDPTYNKDTAQREHWHVVLRTNPGPDMTGAVAGPGHVFIPLGYAQKTGAGPQLVAADHIFPNWSNRLRGNVPLTEMFNRLSTFFGVPLGSNGEPDWPSYVGTLQRVVWLDQNYTTTFTRSGGGAQTVTGAVTFVGTTGIPSDARSVLYRIRSTLPDNGTGHNSFIHYTITSDTYGNPSGSVASQHEHARTASQAVPHVVTQLDFTEQIWIDGGALTLTTVVDTAGDGFTLSITPIAYMV